VGNNPLSWIDPLGLCTKDWDEYGIFVLMDKNTGKIYVVTTFQPGDPLGVDVGEAYRKAVNELINGPYQDEIGAGDDLVPLLFTHRHSAPAGEQELDGVKHTFSPNQFAEADQKIAKNRDMYIYLETRQGEIRSYHPDLNGPPSSGNVDGTYVGKRGDW
jgi:hypothetical protein